MNHLLFQESYLKDIITKGPVVIEEDVWIGSNVVVLSGVTIGRGSIIGAGSIVNSNIPRYSIVGGNPARVIKKRFDETKINIIEKIEWWKWDVEKIKSHKNLFEIDVCENAINVLENVK